MNPQKHVMLDIETFGKGPNAAITAIGACFFDPHQGVVAGRPIEDFKLDSGPTEAELLAANFAFYRKVNLDKSRSPGVIDASTVEWWLKQTKDAQEELLSGLRVPLETALSAFQQWVTIHAQTADDLESFRVWSNGPTFDERIVREAYDRNFPGSTGFASPAWPFHFRASRCMRTMCALQKELDLPEWKNQRFGTKHAALGDAVSQAVVVTRITQGLRHIARAGCGIRELR